MPQATAVRGTQREDLETVEDGFIVIKKFNYGEKLKMRDLAARVHIQQSEIEERRKKAKKARSNGDQSDEDAEYEMALTVEQTNFYMFRKGIVDHNLEDEKGRKLNFNSRSDFQSLDQEVGEEIEDLITTYNPDHQAKVNESPAEGVDPLASASSPPSVPEKVTTPR